jgi:hypothetical protein
MDGDANGLSPSHFLNASNETQGETSFFDLLQIDNHRNDARTHQRPLIGPREGRESSSGMYRRLGEVGWSCDEGKAVIEMDAWR